MRKSVLVVDDQKSFLETCALILGDKYRVDTASSVGEAELKIKRKSYDVVLLDIVLRDALGTDLLAKIKKTDPLTEVIMITGYASIATAKYSMSYDVFAYLERPVPNDLLIKTIDEAIKRRELRWSEQSELERLEVENDQLRSKLLSLHEQLYSIKKGKYRDIAEALLSVMEIKDEYTKSHLTSVRQFTDPISDIYGFTRETRLIMEVASELHDIGKLLISSLILNKKGQLDPEEWSVIREHPATGAVIVGSIPDWEGAARVILHHQERFDGSGYPEGLRGDEIPLLSRIISVADAFHAMTSRRAYRDPMSITEAVGELLRNAGTQFDPDVVSKFIAVLRQLGMIPST